MRNLNNSILFLVDHKHRDLPSISLIGFFLEKYFFKNIYFVATSREDEVIKEINPKFVVIPKVTYGIFNQFKWKLEGRKIIILETEGNTLNDKVAYNIDIYPDLYFFWNKNSKDLYSPRLKRNGVEMIIGGNYRTDIFCEPYKNIFKPKEIKKKIGIKNQKKIITFATSTQEAHATESRQKRNKKKTNRAYQFHPNYDDLIKSLNIQKTITEEFLKKTKKYLKDDIAIVVKPHPHESIIYWEDFFKKNNLTNCFLLYGTNINDLLCISDIHISHGVCNTTAEAKLWGLKTIELWTPYIKKIYSEPHTNLTDYKCFSSDDLFKVLKKLVNNKNLTQDNSSFFESYKRNYFNGVNGRTCFEYAKNLNNYMEKNLNNNRLIFKHYFKYSLFLFLMRLRNFIFFKRTARERKIYTTQISKFTKKELLEFNNGLYDNKIKRDDYKIWFKKFSKINLENYLEG